jgi:hypothetical protein
MEAENPKRRAWWVGGTCCTYMLGVRPAESICVGVGEDVGVGQQAGEGGRYTDECAPRGGQKVDALPGLRRDVQRSPDKASDD